MDYKLCYKVIPMPCDTNSNGDIFGGWLLSQMDLAGVVMCKDHNYGRYATISVDKMIFKKRLYFFSIGLLIGIFLVMFIFRKKNASFNYMPNARVIDNIISKDSIKFADNNNTPFTKADIKEIPKPIFIASDKERNPSFIFLNCINANSNKPVIIRRDTIPAAGGCW